MNPVLSVQVAIWWVVTELSPNVASLEISCFLQTIATTSLCNQRFGTGAFVVSVVNIMVSHIQHFWSSTASHLNLQSWLPLEWKDVYRELVYSEAPSDLRHKEVLGTWDYTIAMDVLYCWEWVCSAACVCVWWYGGPWSAVVWVLKPR